MVRISLQIKAFFENVEKLETEGSNYPYFVKVLCTNCGEKSEKWHDITESVRTSAEDTKNPEGFNFQMKCKMCKRLNTIDIQQNSQDSYTEDDAESFKTIVTFDCRGAEPYEFSPRIGWVVTATSQGQVFHHVDLSKDDWVDYDEKNRQTVGIYDFTSKFIKLLRK